MFIETSAKVGYNVKQVILSANRFIRSTKLYSNKFINYDQKIVCTSTFRLPPEVFVRRKTKDVVFLLAKTSGGSRNFEVQTIFWS